MKILFFRSSKEIDLWTCADIKESHRYFCLLSEINDIDILLKNLKYFAVWVQFLVLTDKLGKVKRATCYKRLHSKDPYTSGISSPHFLHKALSQNPFDRDTKI